MIASRAKPLSARTMIRTLLPKRRRMAGTIFWSASTVPSLASRLQSRSWAKSGIVGLRRDLVVTRTDCLCAHLQTIERGLSRQGFTFIALQYPILPEWIAFAGDQ